MESEEMESTAYTRADIVATLRARPSVACDVHLASLRRLGDRVFADDAAALHQALAWVASYRLVPESQPSLRPHAVAGAPKPRELPESALAALRHVVGELPIDLQARVRDVFWEAGRDANAARQAVHDYMSAAEELAETTSAPRVARRVDRAFAISRMMRADELELRERALRFVEDAGRPSAARILVAAKIRGRGIAGLDRAAVAVDQIVRENPPEFGPFDWEWHRRALGVVAELHAAAGDAQKRDEARIAQANSFAIQARALTASGAAAMMVADLLEKGVRALLKLGRRDDSEALRPELVEAQRQQVAAMRHMSSGSIDLSDAAHAAQQSVRGRTWRDAMLRLVAMVQSPAVSELRTSAERNRNEHPLPFLLPRQTLDEGGRTVAADDDEEELLKRDMIETTTNEGRFAVIGRIEPARRQIIAEHSPGAEEWVALLLEGPIRPERVHSWMLGLDAGLRGDWIVASHLLLPQIENLLRDLLEFRGHSVTSFRDDNVEISNAFGGIVRHPKLASILPENLIGRGWPPDLAHAAVRTFAQSWA